MQQPVWTFCRRGERLSLSREDAENGTTLTVSWRGTCRSYSFQSASRLETFQRDMETMLLKTGWVFESFAPDRRTGRDRRGWPRRANDRRRWWTDSRDKPASAAVEQWEALLRNP